MTLKIIVLKFVYFYRSLIILSLTGLIDLFYLINRAKSEIDSSNQLKIEILKLKKIINNQEKKLNVEKSIKEQEKLNREGLKANMKAVEVSFNL